MKVEGVGAEGGDQKVEVSDQRSEDSRWVMQIVNGIDILHKIRFVGFHD